MQPDRIEYAADHADMQPAVTITRMGKLWRLTWGEPRNGAYPLWHAYRLHCEHTLVPALRGRWPAWSESVKRGSKMALASGSFGFLHHAPDVVVREAVEIIRTAFPHAVVTGQAFGTIR